MTRNMDIRTPKTGANERQRPLVGVSACLLGRPVRYNGGDSRDRYVVDVLGKLFEWAPVCPEMAMGLGAPRDSMRLVRATEDEGAWGGVRLVNPKTNEDLTETARETCEQLVEMLGGRALRGYILKKGSPSCGMERVRVYGDKGPPDRDGEGVFARALAERFPNLPIEEDGRLNDPRLRENFVARVLVYDRWLEMREAGATPSALVRFHTAHKMLLLAHGPAAYKELGRLVARAGAGELEEILDRYESLMMRTLRTVASVGRQVNVLQHLAGYLRGQVEPDARGDIQRVIDDYRQGFVPLVAATTLLAHHLRRLGHAWVDAQVYLEPYPRELGLRNRL